MSEIQEAFRGIARYTEALETPLTGREYLESYQKRRLDRFAARVLHFAGAPVVATARAAVWAEDGGPTMLQLPRVGFGGREFGEYKIRTMKPGSEADRPNLDAKPLADERVTEVGRLLRALSIDELPQARNIAAGEMSLVGSRPKTSLEVGVYGTQDPDFYEAYTSMRPGLTGLEQIRGRAAIGRLDRIELTKEYAAEASVKLDRDIILKTVSAVALRSGAY